MPPAANIEVNGADGSDDDVPINTLVQLSNADVGGELTYFWEIVDQPTGTAVALSSSAIENPTFTPTKEGSYLIRLTVNDALSTEVSDMVVVAVRDLKTNERIPAALETIEVDTAKGWKPAVNRLHELAIDAKTDGNVVVCLNPAASFPGFGDIVSILAETTIKTGLPGEERLFSVTKALATAEATVKGQLGIVIATPTGAAPVASGLIHVRVFGLVEFTEAGSPAAGDPVYVDDTAQPSLSAGTVSRQIGKVVSVGGGNYRWVIDSTIAYLPRIRVLEAGGSTASADIAALQALHTFIGRQRFTAGGTYTPTTGCKRVLVRMVGAGGGGGGVAGSGAGTGSAGGGGASGTYFEQVLSASPIVGGAVTIGAAGGGGAAGANAGSTGGDTSIVIGGVTYTAKGGGGGAPGTGGLAPPAHEGGGDPQSGSSAGDFTSADTGGQGLITGNAGGRPAEGGVGGSGRMGTGGKGADTGTGNAATGFGAGGGGAADWQGSTAYAGGDGTAGLVIVDEYT
jgi:PKD domain